MELVREATPNERELGAKAAAIRELAGHVHAAQARLARMVAEFTADEFWNAEGSWRSVANWLVVNCGLSAAEASTLARVAGAVEEMPTVMAHAERGEVSLGVAAMAARVATPAIDEQLARIVTTATSTQASRLLSQYRGIERRRAAEAAAKSGDGADDESAEESEAIAADSYWRSWFDEDGRYRADIAATPEVGALLEEARAAGERMAARTGDAERPTLSDSLRELAGLALESARSVRLHREGGEPFNVGVLIDIETLVAGTLRPDSVCRLECGPAVTPGLVRRLAEEGTLQAIWHRGGIPLRLGHEVRFASREQRRMLRLRDGGCAVPGCASDRGLHAHHIVHHPAGPTDIDNLVLVCRFHHRVIHSGRLTVETDGLQHFTFRDRHGEVLGNRVATEFGDEERPPPGPLEHHPDQLPLGIDASTARPIGGGERLTDFGANVWMHALLTAA